MNACTLLLQQQYLVLGNRSKKVEVSKQCGISPSDSEQNGTSHSHFLSVAALLLLPESFFQLATSFSSFVVDDDDHDHEERQMQREGEGEAEKKISLGKNVNVL